MDGCVRISGFVFSFYFECMFACALCVNVCARVCVCVCSWPLGARAFWESEDISASQLQRVKTRFYCSVRNQA